MNLLLPEQDFWWVESETTTQINRNMPKVCERRLFVPRRAKCYGTIKWTAAIMVQGLEAVKDLKRYEIKPHWVPGGCFKDFRRWGKWGEARWRIACMSLRKVFVFSLDSEGLSSSLSFPWTSALVCTLGLRQIWLARDGRFSISPRLREVRKSFIHIIVSSIHHLFALLKVTISKGLLAIDVPVAVHGRHHDWFLCFGASVRSIQPHKVLFCCWK